jgi:hypothetical protein
LKAKLEEDGFVDDLKNFAKGTSNTIPPRTHEHRSRGICKGVHRLRQAVQMGRNDMVWHQHQQSLIRQKRPGSKRIRD